MTPDTFAKLKKGDTVRHKLAAHAMTVETDDLPNGTKVLVRRTTASNPDEWLLIGDDGHAIYDDEDTGTEG